MITSGGQLDALGLLEAFGENEMPRDACNHQKTVPRVHTTVRRSRFTISGDLACCLTHERSFREIGIISMQVLVKNMFYFFSPAGFKGNLSLLEFFCFPGDFSKWRFWFLVWAGLACQIPRHQVSNQKVFSPRLAPLVLGLPPILEVSQLHWFIAHRKCLGRYRVLSALQGAKRAQWVCLLFESTPI